MIARDHPDEQRYSGCRNGHNGGYPDQLAVYILHDGRESRPDVIRKHGLQRKDECADNADNGPVAPHGTLLEG